MRAIHGAKTKNDKIDSRKIAMLLRSGMLPQAYVYPAHMRATRDLLRRREYFMHQQSELLEHIQNTNTQYNFPAFPKRIKNRGNRTDIVERFSDPLVASSIEADLTVLNVYHDLLLKLEGQILRQARHQDRFALELLRTVPGVGKVLALVILRRGYAERDPGHQPLPYGRSVHLLLTAGEEFARVGRQTFGRHPQQER